MPSRTRSFRVEAIILRHKDFGEADRLLTIFTYQMGKLAAIAKGVRKPRSRKAGHLEPFTRANLLLARGRELYIITQAEAEDDFQPIRESLVLIGYASYVIELVDRFTYEEGQNLPLYRLLRETLERISNERTIQLTLRFFEIKLLDLVGYRPHLFECASCQSEIKPQDQYFSSGMGGVVCPNCKEHNKDTAPISVSALKYLRHLQRSSFKEASRAIIAESTMREMEIILQRFLTHLLERKLNTTEFIQQVLKGS